MSKKNHITFVFKFVSLVTLVIISFIFINFVKDRKIKNKIVSETKIEHEAIYNLYKDRAAWLQALITQLPADKKSKFIIESNFKNVETSLAYTKNATLSLTTKQEFKVFEGHQEKITQFIAENIFSLQASKNNNSLLSELSRMEQKIIIARKNYLEKIKLLNKKYNVRFPAYLADLRANPEKFED